MRFIYLAYLSPDSASKSIQPDLFPHIGLIQQQETSPEALKISQTVKVKLLGLARRQ